MAYLRLQEAPLDEVARIDEPGFYLGDVKPVYERLRDEAPVWWYERGGVWVISRYDDIRTIERDPILFSAARGAFLGEIPYAPPVGSPAPKHRWTTDPPHHTAYRALFAGLFTSEASAQRRAVIDRVVADAVDAVSASEKIDFTDSIAIPVTVNMIAAVLGVPRSDWQDFKRWSDAYVEIFDVGLSGERRTQVKTEIRQLKDYFADLLTFRRDNPVDDVVSAIAQARIDGQPLPLEAQIETCRSLLVAGNETTRNTLSAGMIALAQHPDTWTSIRQDRTIIPNATEEILRYTSVLLHFIKSASRDTQLGGMRIKRGDFVVLLYASGNFDATAFPQPEIFDVQRAFARPQLAFGYGPHHCLGSALAREEIASVLRALAQRYRGWELAGPVRRRPSTLVDSYDHVPIAFTPER